MHLKFILNNIYLRSAKIIFKDTDFKFDVHVPRNSPDMTCYKICEKRAWPETRDSLKFTWRICALSEYLIVLLFVFQLVNAYSEYDDLAIMFARFMSVNTFE